MLGLVQRCKVGLLAGDLLLDHVLALSRQRTRKAHEARFLVPMMAAVMQHERACHAANEQHVERERHHKGDAQRAPRGPVCSLERHSRSSSTGATISSPS